MQVATGKSILNGIAIGPLRIYKKAETETAVTSSLTPEEEYARFEEARVKAQEQLGNLYEKALDEVGEDNAAIFEIHQMMLDDDDYLEAVKGIIDTQNATAEYAVTTTGNNFAETFAAMEDAYMQARATDVKDISHRVVNILAGREEGGLLDEKPAILVADDLTPSETVQLDKTKLLGFITRYGSSNSHTAILARTMNIPALIGVDFDDTWDGKLAVLDGYNQCVYIDPAQELLSTMEEKRKGTIFLWERCLLLWTTKRTLWTGPWGLQVRRSWRKVLRPWWRNMSSGGSRWSLPWTPTVRTIFPPGKGSTCRWPTAQSPVTAGGFMASWNGTWRRTIPMFTWRLSLPSGLRITAS